MADGSFFPDSPQFPKAAKAVIESLYVYLARNLYGPADPSDPEGALSRVFTGDLDAGMEFVNRSATQQFTTREFANLNLPYPFTLAQPGLPQPDGGHNQWAARGEIYSFVIQRKISTWRCALEIRMVTLCATPDDYNRVHTVLGKDNASQVTLFYGLRFRDELRKKDQIVSAPFTLKWEFGEEQYTNKFQEYLKQNKLYDVQHTAIIEFWDFTASEVLENLEVKELVINYGQLGNLDHLVFAVSLFDPPEASITIEGILNPTTAYQAPSGLSSVDIAFSQAMMELTVEKSLVIEPTIHHEESWDENSKIMTVNFKENLVTQKTYNIKSAQGVSVYSKEFVPFDFEFKTK